MVKPYDFPFTIDDVVGLLGLKRKNIRPSHYQVDCPFCLGKDKSPDHHGHMDINTVKNTFRCNRCDISGGMLALYGYYHRLTNQAAYVEITERLAASSEKRAALQAIRWQQPLSDTKDNPPLSPPVCADSDTLNDTYSHLLQTVGLQEKHRQALLRRGLSLETIITNGYGSMPTLSQNDAIITKLLTQECCLEAVPGFYYDQDKSRWQIQIGGSGLLIPVRDEKHRIQGLQIRCDYVVSSSKYIWLSSADKPFGTKATAAIHIAGKQYAAKDKTVYLTEGPLKADIASFLTGKCFLACPGTSHYKRFETIIPLLKLWGIKWAYNAFDMDSRQNPQVAKHTLCLNALLTKAGFSVRRLVWPEAYKGIDDYLLAAS